MSSPAIPGRSAAARPSDAVRSPWLVPAISGCRSWPGRSPSVYWSPSSPGCAGRLALVPLGGLAVGLRRDLRDQVGPVLRGRDLHGGDDRRRRRGRLPGAAGVPAWPWPTSGRGADALRMAVDPHRRLLLGVVLGLIGLISGITASSAWRTWPLFGQRGPARPQGPAADSNSTSRFFVCAYPFLRLVLSYLFAAAILAAAGRRGECTASCTAGWAGRPGGRRPRWPRRPSLFVLVGVFVLLKGVRLLGGPGGASTSPSAARGHHRRASPHRRQRRAALHKTVLGRHRRAVRPAVLRRGAPARRSAVPGGSGWACWSCRRS